jgi:hypothetical protein
VSFFALAACVTPLRDEHSTAACVQGALLKSGWASDVQVHASEKAQWTVTFRAGGQAGGIAEVIQINHDMIDGRGLYYVTTGNKKVRDLLRWECPGAADEGDYLWTD